MRSLWFKAGHRVRPVFIAAWLMSMAGAAQAAANFSVYPLKLSLPAAKLSTSLTLGNVGTAPVTVQAEVLRWTQGVEGEQLLPTQDLVVSPPIFRIAPGSKQQVRVGRLQRGSAPVLEGSYRLLLTEVVPEAGLRVGVSTAMRLSLPVFVPPASRGATPQLSLLAAHADATTRTLRLQLRNEGPVHGKLLGSAVEQDGVRCAETSHNEYLLPMAMRELRVPQGWRGCAAGAATVRLRMQGRPEMLVQDVMLPASSEP